MKALENLLQEIKIYDCEHTKIRLGSPNDGGYVILDEPCQQTKMLYSVGIGDDMNFEIDFLNRYPNTKATLYDPNIDQLPQEHERATFIKKGVEPRGERLLENVSPQSVLKMDVEGAEWDFFRFITPRPFRRFSQIIIEFHFIHVDIPTGLSPYFRKVYNQPCKEINRGFFRTYARTISKINHMFYCFHAHVNNSLPMMTLDGLQFPPLLEMSFIRKDLVKGVKETEQEFPVDNLDAPNKLDRDDILDWYPLWKEE